MMMGRYRRYVVTIKEKENGNVLRPEYSGNVDEDFLIDFFGLNNPDVEWYKIEEI